MTQRHVLILAGVSAVALGFFTLGLHEWALAAGEAEIRVACRALCELAEEGPRAEAVAGPVGGLIASFHGVACRAMSDQAPQLKRCRDALLDAEISVADYHCLRDASDGAEAKGCDVL